MKLGKLLAPRKKMKSRWCSSSASISGEAPARWRSFNGWRSGGASPWLGVEREKFLSEWDEGESTGCSGGRGGVADEWGMLGGTWREVFACWTRTEVHWRTVRGWGADYPGC